MMRSPNSVEQRPQQQKRVAVPAADVFAVDEDSRIAPQRVGDAERDGIEECVALAIEREPWVFRRQRRAQIDRKPRLRLERLDALLEAHRRRRLRVPASAGSGHGASITARASVSTSSTRFLLEALERRSP